MEPVTHVLTGICLARAVTRRRVAYAAVGMGVAAEFPDIDTLWSLQGPVTGFQHHRGITHTLLGIPVEAALLLGVIYAFHRWRSGRRGKAPIGRTNTIPTRWPALYGCLALALLSHLLLDFTNNYGIRPFFPFDRHWYEASIVFIFDPLLFVLLVAGLLVPALFRLVGQEVTGKRDFSGDAAWATVALVLMVLFWGLRSIEHRRALEIATENTLRQPVEPLPSSQGTDESKASSREESARALLRPRKVTASPDPLNPFRWYIASDFGPAYQLATADSRAGTLTTGATLNKPAQTREVAVAKRSRLGCAYLNWSAMPLIVVSPGTGRSEHGTEAKYRILFEDLRFSGSTPLLQRASTPPLTGEVDVNEAGEVTAQGMDGRFER